MRVCIIAIFLFIALIAYSQANVKQNNTKTGSRVSSNTALYRFSFSLPEAASYTSAGIYDPDGILVRTLWANRPYAAGSHTETWDGNDDTGRLVPDPTSCSWQITTNKLTYTWEGVIGNTSRYLTGASIHKGLGYTTALCFSGRYMYAGQSYNEGTTRTSKTDTGNVQQRTLIDDTGGTPDITDCATDGTYVYWAGTDANATVTFGNRTLNNAASFVYATRIGNDTLVSFPAGTAYKKIYGHVYSAIGLLAADTSCTIGGIAVQKTGSYLYLTHPEKNLVAVYNKTTGAFVTSLSVGMPTRIRIDGSDKYLWLTHGTTTTEKYSIHTDGTLSASGITIRSEQEVLAMDINASTLLICEGGSHQYIKAYNPVTGAYLWTYGLAGGYLANATVANDKFYWRDVRQSYQPFVAFAPDGSFWVGDNGNNRMQHFSANRAFLNRISWTPIGYAIAVDPNNASRVFFLNMEYRVDYSKPLAPDNGSWQLVRNWGGDITNGEYSIYTGIKEPVTFSNGSTFCYLRNPADASNLTYQLVKLNDDGTKTRTGIVKNILWYIDKSGDLYQQDRIFTGKPMKWYKAPFTGYNKNGYPEWGPSVVLDSIARAEKDDPGYRGDPNHYHPNLVIDKHIYIAYDNTAMNTGYHLGAVSDGKWLWKTELATYKYYGGDFPAPDRFDIGNGVRNAGTLALTVGNTVITGYNGEFYKGNQQTNIYNHIYQNGLPLGQFGYAGEFGSSQVNPAGFAGNALSMAVVPMGDSAYLYHNDESIHGGVHRWKIKGLNTIRTFTGRIFTNLTSRQVSNNNADLLNGLELTKGNFISSNGSGWTFSDVDRQSREYGNSWIVCTQKFSYDENTPDLSFYFRSVTVKADTALRNLTGLLPEPVTNWKLEQLVNFQSNNTNNDQVQFYMDVLDNRNKLVVRIWLQSVYGQTKSLVMYANGIPVFTVPLSQTGIIYRAQLLSIRSTGNQVAVSYAGQPEIRVAPFDTEASVLNPARLRYIFNQAAVGNHYSLGLGILSAHFYTNL